MKVYNPNRVSKEMILKLWRNIHLNNTIEWNSFKDNWIFQKYKYNIVDGQFSFFDFINYDLKKTEYANLYKDLTKIPL